MKITKYNLKKVIERRKNKLIKKAKENGLWENFGQSEVAKICDKYDYFTLRYGTTEEREKAKLIENFNEWCMNVNDSDLK